MRIIKLFKIHLPKMKKKTGSRTREYIFLQDKWFSILCFKKIEGRRLLAS